MPRACADPSVMRAYVTDPASLRELAGNARVVATTVGRPRPCMNGVR